MNKLADAMAQKATEKLTENGDKAYSTTKSACLDLFALGGSMRYSSESEILSLWRQAEAEDRVLALKILFFIRSAREGLGERRTFRIIWNSLNRDVQTALMALVPEVGRFDDLEDSVILNSQIAMWIRENLEYEYRTLDDGQSPSLLAKWLPCGRGNRSAKERTRRMAERLGYKEEEYRKKVVALRKKLNLVESKMANNEWSEIDYSKLPSLAGHKYVKAFYRHDPERYNQYLQQVLNGTAKMNASVLTPAEVIHGLLTRREESVSEAEWKSLPDYTRGHNALAIVDVSGSMESFCSVNSRLRAKQVAIAMGMYLSERTEGPFQNMVLSFDSVPRVVRLSPKESLYQRYKDISNSPWGYTTNLRAAFDLILELAVKSNCSQEELPETLFIFTDMEFDTCCYENDLSSFESAKKAFEEKGYTLPKLVFWNLNARNKTLPVQMNERGVALVSGYSTRMFQQLMGGDTDPMSYMLDTLNEFRYSKEIEASVK